MRRWFAIGAAAGAVVSGAVIVATDDPPARPAAAAPSNAVIHYVVVSGDSWVGIANQYGLSGNDLARQNRSTISAALQPGMILHVIPGVPPTTTTTSTTLPPSTTTSTTLPPTSTTTTSSTTTSTSTTTTTVAPTTTTTQPPSQGFLATFDTPGDFYDRFERHTGNYCTVNQPPNCRPEDGAGESEFPGSHNLACQPPPTQRVVLVEDHDNLFWWCAPGGAPTGHVMTGLNTSGYSLVSFAPAQSFTNVSEICWDISLADLGGGKWFNVVMVPEATYLSHPNQNPDRVVDGEGPYRLDYVTPDFVADNGPGDFNIQDLGSGAGALFGIKSFRGTTQIYQGAAEIAFDGDSFTAGSDESTRYTHCFRDNGNGTVTYEQERFQDTVHTVTTTGSFPNGAVRVLFQDDTYDADKHSGTGRYTWHWDNISVT